MADQRPSYPRKSSLGVARIGCGSAAPASEVLSSRRAIARAIKGRGEVLVCGWASDHGATAVGTMSFGGKHSNEKVLEVRF